MKKYKSGDLIRFRIRPHRRAFLALVIARVGIDVYKILYTQDSIVKIMTIGGYTLTRIK